MDRGTRRTLASVKMMALMCGPGGLWPAAIVQEAVIVGLTIFLVLGQISIVKPEVS